MNKFLKKTYQYTHCYKIAYFMYEVFDIVTHRLNVSPQRLRIAGDVEYEPIGADQAPRVRVQATAGRIHQYHIEMNYLEHLFRQVLAIGTVTVTCIMYSLLCGFISVYRLWGADDRVAHIFQHSIREFLWISNDHVYVTNAVKLQVSLRSFAQRFVQLHCNYTTRKSWTDK